MPGILGIIEKVYRLDSASVLQRVIDCLNHDGSFVSGALAFEGLGAHLGCVGRPGSFAGRSPIWNRTRDVCLILCGEVFGGRSEIDALVRDGLDCDAKDARHLVTLYEEMGIAFLRALNGLFSGVLVDLREEKLVLFNDRYGLSRVYFHDAGDAFYFASEAKALLKVLPALRSIDPVALGEFFTCGCALNNRTLFSGVSLLPAGAAWTWLANQGLVRHSYFEPAEWENQAALSTDCFYDRLKEVFRRIVPRYFAGPQPVGMSVTGGLDSRMIMAGLRPEPGSLKCYTFGGMYRESADVRIGRAVARACGQSFEVLSLSSDFFSQFPKLAMDTVRLTDGAMDVSGAANLYLNRLARGIAPVRMTGNYGGEILRGITGLKAHPIDDDLFDPGFVPTLRRVPEVLSAARQVPLPTFIAFKQVPWYHYGMLSVEQSQLSVRTPYLDSELVALSYQAPTDLQLNKNLAFRFVAESDSRLASLPNDRGAVWKPRAGLATSRSRLRYLREEFLPKAEYYYDYGMPDWLARLDRAISPLRVERLFLGNQKFCHFRTWYRRELSGFVREILLDPRTLGRPFLNRRRVEQVVSSHIAGVRNHTLAIHKLLSIELLYRTVIERDRCSPGKGPNL